MAQITKKTVAEGISQKDTYDNIIEILENYGAANRTAEDAFGQGTGNTLSLTKNLRMTRLHLCPGKNWQGPDC